MQGKEGMQKIDGKKAEQYFAAQKDTSAAANQFGTLGNALETLSNHHQVFLPST